VRPTTLITCAALTLSASTAHAQGALEDPDEAPAATVGESTGTVRTKARRVDGELEGKPQRVERISSEQLRRRGATNLAEALEWLSAGSATSPTGTATGLIIDGLPGSQLTVLRDGLPVARPSGSPQGPLVDLSSVPVDPDTIERIDIYRGVGPVGSGATGGVVIDVITRRTATTTSAFARAQVMGTADDAVGADGASVMNQTYSAGGQVPIGDALSLAGSGRWTDVSALDVDGDLDPDAAARELNHGELTLTWRPTTNSYLLGQVLSTGSDTEALGGPRAAFDDIVERRTTRGRVRGRWWLGQDVRLDHHTEVSRAENAFKKRVRSSGFERLKSDTSITEARQSGSLTVFMADHDLAFEVAGGGFEVERDGETGSLGTRRRLEGGLGVADTWYVGEEVELFGRLFVDGATDFGAGANAQVSGAWRVLEPLALRASISTTRRAPTPEELYLEFDHSEVGYQLTGNEDLAPERLYSAQASFIWTTEDKHAGVELMGFTHLIEDAIVPTQTGPDPSLFTYENTEGALTAGGQVSAQLRELPGGFSVLANYTALPLAAQADGAPLALRATHSGRVEVRGAWFDRTLEAWGDVAARSEMNVPEGSMRAPANALVGLGVSWRFGKYGRAMLDLDNLLDQTNPVWGPMPGRTARLTLEMRLGGEAL
jgi:outer membrane receptor protein involved in Fe transport